MQGAFGSRGMPFPGVGMDLFQDAAGQGDGVAALFAADPGRVPVWTQWTKSRSSRVNWSPSLRSIFQDLEMPAEQFILEHGQARPRRMCLHVQAVAA